MQCSQPTLCQPAHDRTIFAEFSNKSKFFAALPCNDDGKLTKLKLEMMFHCDGLHIKFTASSS